jgi:hypothetical protein
MRAIPSLCVAREGEVCTHKHHSDVKSRDRSTYMQDARAVTKGHCQYSRANDQRDAPECRGVAWQANGGENPRSASCI